MGREKAEKVRSVASSMGWLQSEQALPQDAELARVLRSSPRVSTPSTLEPFREQVLAWHSQGLKKTTILRLLRRRHSYAGSYSSLCRFLDKLDLLPKQRTMRLHFAPGEAAQVDFGSGPKLPDPITGELRKTWFFLMTLCWSRHQYAEIVWDQKVATWLACHQRAFRFFGGVPQRIVLDNAKCAITKARIRDPEKQRAYAELAEAYDLQLAPCPPRDPQKKGRVEAGVKYLMRGFLPGRDLHHLQDANRQLEACIVGEAGQRIHGTTRERPLTRFTESESCELKPLPPESLRACRVASPSRPQGLSRAAGSWLLLCTVATHR